MIAGSLFVLTWLEGPLRQAQDICGDQHLIQSNNFSAKNGSWKGEAALCPQALLSPSQTQPQAQSSPMGTQPEFLVLPERKHHCRL